MTTLTHALVHGDLPTAIKACPAARGGWAILYGRRGWSLAVLRHGQLTDQRGASVALDHVHTATVVGDGWWLRWTEVDATGRRIQVDGEGDGVALHETLEQSYLLRGTVTDVGHGWSQLDGASGRAFWAPVSATLGQQIVMTTMACLAATHQGPLAGNVEVIDELPVALEPTGGATRGD